MKDTYIPPLLVIHDYDTYAQARSGNGGSWDNAYAGNPDDFE